MSKELKFDLSGKEYAQFFLDDGFLKTLGDASKITRKTGNETAFEVLNSLIGRSHVYSSIGVGTSYNLQRDEGHTTVDNYNLGTVNLFGMHFHPERTGPTLPSEGDLSLMYGPTNSNINLPEMGVFEHALNRIEGVGMNRDDRSVDLLVFQYRFKSRCEFDEEGNPFFPHARTVSEDITSYLYDRGVPFFDAELVAMSDISNDEIVDVMRKGGYNAMVLNFSKDIFSQRGRASFRKKSLESFASQLEPFSQKIHAVNPDLGYSRH